MATVIDLGGGRFIAGDPTETLGANEHWCGYCAGDGLEYDHNDELTPCLSCNGSGVVACTDDTCPEHPCSSGSTMRVAPGSHLRTSA